MNSLQVMDPPPVPTRNDRAFVVTCLLHNLSTFRDIVFTLAPVFPLFTAVGSMVWRMKGTFLSL